MQLEFLNRLNKEQIIELINYINSKEEYAHITKEVQILAEPDRCDEFGNQEILVNAWNGPFHVGTYQIQDYVIKNMFCGCKDSIKELREYLASIFGEEYLNGLREYYAIQAEKEIERIKSTLGVGRS